MGFQLGQMTFLPILGTIIGSVVAAEFVFHTHRLLGKRDGYIKYRHERKLKKRLKKARRHFEYREFLDDLERRAQEVEGSLADEARGRNSDRRPGSTQARGSQRRRNRTRTYSAPASSRSNAFDHIEEIFEDRDERRFRRGRSDATEASTGRGSDGADFFSGWR